MVWLIYGRTFMVDFITWIVLCVEYAIHFDLYLKDEACKVLIQKVDLFIQDELT